jgi:hypothetical protein
MVALVAAVALAGPPKAFVRTASGTTRLAVSSWCWASRCGAPFSASRRPALAAPGSVVTVVLTFAPTRARVAVGGRRVAVTIDGDAVSWRASRGGGLTVAVTGRRGWVTYVGRIRLR